MLKSGDKPVGKLSKSFGQLSALPTVSTIGFLRASVSQLLSSLKSTASTQFFGGFTQPILAYFNLLVLSLYPVSTRPINNTNLIKEL